MFSANAWVKIWELEDKGSYYIAKMSTSRKKDNGDYEQDWSDGRVRLVSTAAKQAASMNNGDRAQIASCGVTNNYDKEKKVLYTNYTIFAFVDNDNTNNTTKNTTKNNTRPKSNSFVDVDEEGELPFA